MSDDEFWGMDDEAFADCGDPPVGPVREKVNAVLGTALGLLWIGWLALILVVCGLPGRLKALLNASTTDPGEPPRMVTRRRLVARGGLAPGC